jgi:drug/metabolite transporter (DMT)-like permease
VPLWVAITIGAAFVQNLRSALQKHLTGELSTTGATFVRFAFGLPFAFLYLAGLFWIGGYSLPAPNPLFVLCSAVGGLAQILGTALLIQAFSYRNFAVGTAYSKTETVQTAIFGIVILGEPIGWAAALAIMISLAGVMVLSVARSPAGLARLWEDLTSTTALLGVGSGAGFAIAAICYRAASVSLAGPGFLMQAAYTLACVIAVQSLAMAAYMAWREPAQLSAVWRARRVALWVGLCGMAASAGWFTAMTIQNAALVRALGQIELVFTFAASHFAFRERTTAKELVGILLVIGGILILLLGG